MSPQLQARPAHRHDEVDMGGPWSILPIADTLLERRSSTTTRLGMPFVVPELDDLFAGAERMTGAVMSWTRQFWQTYISSTESGITYASTPRRCARKCNAFAMRSLVGRASPVSRSLGRRCRSPLDERVGQR